MCLYAFVYNAPDDDLVDVKTCKRNVTNDYLLLTLQFVGSSTVYSVKCYMNKNHE